MSVCRDSTLESGCRSPPQDHPGEESLVFYVTDGQAHEGEGWSRGQVWNCLTRFHRSPGQAACNRPGALRPIPVYFTLVNLGPLDLQ